MKNKSNRKALNIFIILILALSHNSCTSENLKEVTGSYKGEAEITTWGYEEVYDSIGTFLEYKIQRDTTITQDYLIQIIESSGSEFFINESFVVQEYDTLIFNYIETNVYKYLDEFDGITSKRVCLDFENDNSINYEFYSNSQYSSVPSKGVSVKYTGFKN